MRKFTDSRQSVAPRLAHVALIIPLLAALCLTLAPWAVGRVRATAAKPPTDWSFYILDGNTSTASTLGCNQGHFDASFSPPVNSLVVLDFGIQNTAGTGTITTFSNKSLTNTQIENVVNAFALQYFGCTGNNDTTSVLTLAIGTNDSDNYSTSTYTALGQDWANLTQTEVSANRGYSSQVTIWAANDIESWANGSGFFVPSADANAWVSAYSNIDPAAMDNYGSADSCPNTGNGLSNQPCGSGYHQSDYYYYSWGARPAVVSPETYSNYQAQEWAQISLYAQKSLGVNMFFEGPWDENDLNSSTLTSSQAWTDFSNDLSGVGVNAFMPYSAEIHCEYSGQC